MNAYPEQIDYTLGDIEASDTERVLESHALLKEVMGAGVVEDLNSYRITISATHDSAIAPKVLGAFSGDKLVGVIVGAYLRNLGMGFIAYAAVMSEWQKRGIYGSMRSRLIDRLKEQHGISFMVSELDGDDWLIGKYVRDWKAVPMPCAYEQPEVQGLRTKPFTLVLTPVVEGARIDNPDTISIVSEIYKRIYRISNPEENESFRRIKKSVKSPSLTESPQ